MGGGHPAHTRLAVLDLDGPGRCCTTQCSQGANGCIAQCSRNYEAASKQASERMAIACPQTIFFMEQMSCQEGGRSCKSDAACLEETSGTCAVGPGWGRRPARYQHQECIKCVGGSDPGAGCEAFRIMRGYKKKKQFKRTNLFTLLAAGSHQMAKR